MIEKHFWLYQSFHNQLFVEEKLCIFVEICNDDCTGHKNIEIILLYKTYWFYISWIETVNIIKKTNCEIVAK